jgi:phage replication O-like protein O
LKKTGTKYSCATLDLYDLEENHWTPLPNEIVESLCMVTLGAHETRVLWCLLRKTFGFHSKDNPKHLPKKLDQISLSQFEAMTGLDRRRVHEALCRLKERRIITVLPGQDRKAKTYGINFTISQWELSYRARTEAKKGKNRKSVLAGQDKPSYVARTQLSPAAGTDLSYPDAHTKETKENLKESLKESALDPRPFDGARVRASEEDRKEDRKKLSAQRNRMAVSKLYTDEELLALRDKSVDELETIHAGRVLGRVEAVGFAGATSDGQ